MEPVAVLFGRFPQNLRYLREAENLSRAELAKHLKISASHLERLENGRIKTLRSDLLGRFAVFYDITTDEILSGDLSNVESVRTRFYEKMKYSFSDDLMRNVMLAFRETRKEILDDEKHVR